MGKNIKLGRLGGKCAFFCYFFLILEIMNKKEPITASEFAEARGKKQVIYCDYCQHDLKIEGFICHQSQEQANIGNNYFIID
jgi:hypothetical protein